MGQVTSHVGLVVKRTRSALSTATKPDEEKRRSQPDVRFFVLKLHKRYAMGSDAIVATTPSGVADRTLLNQLPDSFIIRGRGGF